jgi:Tol biopolymer transport system component/tRNA A-37 threonylcarbamoyl transferase component Bud32
MTPERWKQIERLYQAALEREPNQRAAFLKEACAGDEVVRQEVESLLAYEPHAEGFIEAPAPEAAAKGLAGHRRHSLVGQQLGLYKVLSLLGAGGMGEVYLARDTRLERTVAVKVLPAELIDNPERLKRFEQEAKAASRLNHPNIITIHGIDRADGLDFITMEYVAGKTLDKLIPRKGMPLKQALPIAIQMADALAAAHRAGLVHRDLKPGNVMVSESGHVKVLDFGLAKLTEPSTASELDSAETLQTGTRSLTEEGVILGTVAYMSPEQAEGKNLDARSDIFSFGSVLYETVTGRKAFQGDSTMATLTAILREEPQPASQAVKGLPQEAERIISRCLRKDRVRRWQNMADLKVALQELKEESDSGKLAPQRGRRRNLIWGAALLALLGAAAAAVWFSPSHSGVPEEPLTAIPLTSYPGHEGQPAFSPDGNQVAFVWDGEKHDNSDIYVKLIGPGTQLRLTTAPEDDSCPAWSPDGSSIAFIREGSTGKASVYLVSPLGPPERKVAEINRTTSWPTCLAWTPDGEWLVVTDRKADSEPLGLFLLSVESGERRRLTSPPEKVFIDSQPAFSSDGRTLAFIREVGIGVRDIYLLSVAGDFQPVGEPKRLTFENRVTFRPVWTLAGQEIVFSSGPLFGPSLFRIAASGSGKPQRLTAVGEDGSEAAISHRTQRLVYTRELIDVNVWRLEVPGSQGQISSPTKLISTTRVDMEAQFSPDGKKIVFNSNRSGSFEIWICDSDGSNSLRLTSLGGLRGYCGNPHWSPDGEYIAFTSIVEDQWDVYVIGTNGGKPKRLTSSPAADTTPSWSRDGKWVYFASDRSGESQVWKVPSGGGEAVPVTRKGGFATFESPDGQWVYYTKSDNAGSLWKVSREGGEETQVLESVDKRAFAIVNEGIFFIPRPDSAGHHSIQYFDFATKKIRSISTLESVLESYLSVSPDRRWIIYSQVDQQGSDIMLVENFH